MLFYRIIILISFISFAQEELLDSSRFCYDYKYSHLTVEFFLNNQEIIGANSMEFKKKCKIDTFNLDLAENMIVDSILILNQKTDFIRKKNSVLIPNYFKEIDDFVITVFYKGKPQIAKKPPWDGGFVWSKDSNNLNWVGVACQMDGASIWWPTKDDLADEPDSLRMTFIVKKPYLVVANGQLESVNDYSDKRSFSWFVKNPINSYNVTFNIAQYRHFNDTLEAELGDLSMDYYVLDEHFELAKQHFVQVDSVIHIFEGQFGPYPFYEDGYKLVESPYLGMEHQSCIAYGNKYMKGYLGNYPEDIDFDFIIIHETAHEWWGNSISMKSERDMWIHESFATYAEALYVENFYDYNKMLVYLNFQKQRIKNNYPIVSSLHFDTDMYYKGSWVLHTLRTILSDDLKWFNILRGLQLTFYHQNVNTEEIIDYIKAHVEYDLDAFFDQYLFSKQIPVLEYSIKKRKNKYFLRFRWNDVQVNFNMPLLVQLQPNISEWIYPNTKWQEIDLENDIDTLYVENDLFLINVLKVK